MHISHETTPQLEALRQEVSDWLEAEFSPEYAGVQITSENRPEVWAYYKEFWKKVGAKGWLEPGWPREYGGLEMSPRQCRVIEEEFRRRRVAGLAGIGKAVSPVLFRVGTDEQKAKFLPGMASGEIMWSEGYTEPESGSDLASLRTRADREGDEWVLNGQKTMTTNAHILPWIFIAARTDPNSSRHHGISYFMSPGDAPGLEYQALYSLAGGRQNMTFIENLRVPADGLLGNEGNGWNEIWFSLGGKPIPVFEDDDPGPEQEYDPPLYEGFFGGGTWVLDQLIKYCQTHSRNGALLIEDPVVRMQIAEMAIGVEIDKMEVWEGPCQYGPNTKQVLHKEWVPDFAQKCLDIVGPVAVLEVLGPLGEYQDLPLAPVGGHLEWLYRRSLMTHAGGAPQVRRMVVATRTLGLPR